MTNWELIYDVFNLSEEGHRETLCTLGNGYFATRGPRRNPAPTGYIIPVRIWPALQSPEDRDRRPRH